MTETTEFLPAISHEILKKNTLTRVTRNGER